MREAVARARHVAVQRCRHLGHPARDVPRVDRLTAELLTQRGAVLSYHDDYVPALPEFGLESSPLAEVMTADAVVLVTAHPGLDYGAIVTRAPLFVDLRGRTRRLHGDTLVQL